MWHPLVADNHFEIHMRSTEIRNIQTHEHPQYIIQEEMYVVLSDGQQEYQTVIMMQFEAFPNMVFNMLIRKELRENIKEPNTGLTIYPHHWVNLVANPNYRFNLRTMRVWHRDTHAIPPIVLHNGAYCMVLDNVFHPYETVLSQQFLAYHHILYEEETEDLLHDLVEERVKKILHVDDLEGFIFNISTADE